MTDRYLSRKGSMSDTRSLLLFTAASDDQCAVRPLFKPGITAIPTCQPTLWRTSAIWGTKGAEGFAAIWQTSAVWGTKSASSDDNIEREAFQMAFLASRACFSNSLRASD